MEDSLKVLGLNKKEERVITALLRGFSTPLTIAKESRVSRPGVYHILERLSRRGIVAKGKYTHSGKWFIANGEDIEQLLHKSSRSLSATALGHEQILRDNYGPVLIYRGKKAIRGMVTSLFDNHSGERVYVFQGTVAQKDWEKFFSLEETNALNIKIKENGLIMDTIFPVGWIEKEVKEFGASWAEAYEGRTARTCVISPEYFTHRASLFMFRDSVYLFTLHEEVAIVIKNSEIQKMIFALFSAVGDSAQTIDLNARIRELVPGQERKAP